MSEHDDICVRVGREVAASEEFALGRPEDWWCTRAIVYDTFDRAATIPKSRSDREGTAQHIAHHDPANIAERNRLDRLLVAEVLRLRGEVEDLREALARGLAFERR